MEENKLTDEEIVQSLACCVKGESCVPCPYFIKKIDCVYKRRAEGDALDFIHRQKAEIERLKDQHLKLMDEHDEYGNLAVERFIEIEELKEQNAELQRQVDELKNRRIEPKIFQCHANALENCHKVEQAVKATVKEICDLILECWEKKHFVECDWLRVEISERYGVEVD